MDYRVLTLRDKQTFLTNSIIQLEKDYYDAELRREFANLSGERSRSDLEHAMAKYLTKREIYIKELDKVNAEIQEVRNKKAQQTTEPKQSPYGPTYGHSGTSSSTSVSCTVMGCDCMENLRTQGGVVLPQKEKKGFWESFGRKFP